MMTLVLEGPAVSRTYPLLEVCAILIDTTTILRNSTLNAIVPLVRESGPVEIELRGAFPRPGSYVQEIGINILQFAHNNVVPVMLNLPLPEIVKYTNDVLGLAEHLKKLLRRKKTPHIERVSQETAIVTSDGEETLEVSVKALDSLNPAIGLLSQLDPDRFRSIELRTPEGAELKIKYEAREKTTPGELKELAAVARRLRKEAKHGGLIQLDYDPALPIVRPTGDPISLSGSIRELDFDSKSGHFQTSGDDTVREGTYPFVLVGDQSLTSVRDLMGEGTVVMVCVLERRRNKIVRLYAVSLRKVLQAT